MIYLNTVEEGGETIFPSINMKVPLKKERQFYFIT